MTNIPQTPGRFKQWRRRENKDWPPELLLLAEKYAFCVQMNYANRGNEVALEASKRANAADMKAFEDALAAHKKSKE